VEFLADRVPIQVAETLEAELPGHFNGAAAFFELGFGQRDHQAAGPLQIAIDLPAGQIVIHPGNVPLTQRGQPAGFRFAEVLDGQTVTVIDRFRQHPGVAAAGAVCGGALLHHRDRRPRFELFQRERGPETGEPGADDGHIGFPIAVERLRRNRCSGGQPVAGLLDRRVSHAEL